MFEPRAPAPLLAAALILCATAFIALTTLLAKALGTDTFGPPLPALQISHGRFLFAFLAIASVAAARGLRPSGVHWRLHVARTSLGWAGVSLMFASVAFIPLADATAISFLNPVFCMILAIPLLGEKVGPVRWGAAGVALIGALVLLRPTPDSFQPAALLALGAAVVMGLELIFIRKLSTREPPLQILLINNAIGLCIATAAVLPVWQAPTGAQWLALAGVGIAMAAAQACFVNGMARGDASFVAPFSYATLIFAALWDGLAFAVWPDAITVLGAGIILGGAVLLAWREAQLARKTRRTGMTP
ncbi:DMT family transporter [Aliishimia ponticola]|uniref:DMT family transporter n=1 Tax=Aliishimia ponticola TaxID=2499833 RepID=A0A4S4NBX7_9RHOB|nr:DMT family transporter [Aliishimia ponticola]THH35967.1 DMT family transporter [Aliishimia ponticola]